MYDYIRNATSSVKMKSEEWFTYQNLCLVFKTNLIRPIKNPHKNTIRCILIVNRI